MSTQSETDAADADVAGAAAEEATATVQDEDDEADYKPASTFYDILMQARANAPPSHGTTPAVQVIDFGVEQPNDKKTEHTHINVLDGAPELIKRIDDAVNKAAQSRRSKAKAKKDDYTKTYNASEGEGITALECAAKSLGKKDNKKKSWKLRARETDWENTEDIWKNFPRPGQDQYAPNYWKKIHRPPLYMFSKYDCVLLKAHAITAWHKFCKIEQDLARRQFKEMKVVDKYLQQQEEKKAKKEIKKAKVAASRRARDDRRNEGKRKRRAAAREEANKKAELRRANMQFARSANSMTAVEPSVPDEDSREYLANLAQMNQKSMSGIVEKEPRRKRKKAKTDAAKDDDEEQADGEEQDVADSVPERSLQHQLAICIESEDDDILKNMVRALIDSGKFDDIVRARMEQLEIEDDNSMLQELESEDASDASIADLV